MNFGKIFDLMANQNIDQGELFSLVDSVRNLDFENEENLRQIIRRVSVLANKNLDRKAEDDLVKRIKTNGVPDDLFGLF